MKLPEGMTKKEHNELIAEYDDRKKLSEVTFREWYNKIKNSRKAFIQHLPDDITYSSSDAGKTVGNDTEDEKYQSTQSAMLSPMFTAVSVRAIEDLSAMPFRFEYSGNNSLGDDLRRVIERRLRSTYTKNNIDTKLALARFSFIVNGVSVTQTIYTNKTRKLLGDKTVKHGAGVDVLVYDPLQTYFDPNASIYDLRNTSEFIIVTVGFYSSEHIKKKYNLDYSVGAGDSSEDAAKKELQNDHGQDQSDAIPIREYYTADGRFYTIVNDQNVVQVGSVSNGDADRIPINVAPSFMTMDSKLGLTIWEKVKWPVAMMSRAINQIADNNARNNNMPVFMPQGMNPEVLTDESMSGLKIMEVTPVVNPNKMQIDLRKLVYRPEIREVTPGAQMLYQIGQESLFYNTGTSPMSFGVQDKQIRNEAVAGMIAQSLVRAESDIAKNIENGFINPTSWDILQIMALKAKDFNLEPKNAQAMLDNLESIRVVNGSYLPGDKMVRLEKLSTTIQLAQQDPGRYNLEDIYYDFFDALGFADPYKYIKSGLQMTKERLAMAAMEAGGQITPEVQKVINQIAALVDEEEQGGANA